MIGGGKFIARHMKTVLTDKSKMIEEGKAPADPTLGADFFPAEVETTNSRLSHAGRTKRAK